jgi:hypothetical protein
MVCTAGKTISRSQVIVLPAPIHVDAKTNLGFIEFGGIDHFVIMKGWFGGEGEFNSILVQGDDR